MLHRLFMGVFALLFFLVQPVSAQSKFCLKPLSGTIICVAEADPGISLGDRVPVFIFPGWNSSTVILAEPNLDNLKPLVEFLVADPQIKTCCKIYIVPYFSNMVSISDLGRLFGNYLDEMNAANPTFASRPIIIVAYSMGGLIARAFMIEYVQQQGLWAGKVGGYRVNRVVTVGVPFEGSPMANGAARDWAAKGSAPSLIAFDNFFYGILGPAADTYNRFDLHWENRDSLLNYNLFSNERNYWLEKLNADTRFDSKFFAYAGNFIPKKNCESYNQLQVYCYGSTILAGQMSLINDGVVPVASALFYDNGRSRVNARPILEDYNHTDIVYGKPDGVLFNSIKQDILNGLPISTQRSRTDILDFDGDGRGDVFGYDPESGNWEIYFHDPNGYFRIQYGQWSSNLTIKAGDFNGDGLTDLFVYKSSTGEWAKAINDGQGGFKYFESRWSPGWDPYIVDLDGNGHSDVFIYNFATGQWFKCTSLGDGAGEFAYSSGTWSNGWHVYTAEFNGDGKADIFLYYPWSGQWFKAINDSGQGFIYTTGFWDHGWQITPGDYSGDQLTDLLLYNSLSGQWVLAINNTSGFNYRSGFWSQGWWVTAGDFDGNGLQDPFLYFLDNPQWYTVLNRNGGDFFYYSGRRTIIGQELHVVDFDGDGKMDLLEYDPNSGTVMQWMSRGTGDFRYRLNFVFPNRILLTGR